MKIWYHVIAAVVGLALAALIVYLVFGNASQQGAVQDGTAPDGGGAGAAELCGTIAPGQTGTPATRRLAEEHPPSLFDDVKPLAGISPDQPQQQAWVNRVHAATGLCADELHITTEAIRIVMSTPEGMSEQDLGRHVGNAVRQAFTKPLNRNRVVVLVTVDGAERRVAISARAWNAFRALRRPVTVANLKRFRATTGFKAADLRIVGW